MRHHYNLVLRLPDDTGDFDERVLQDYYKWYQQTLNSTRLAGAMGGLASLVDFEVVFEAIKKGVQTYGQNSPVKTGF